MSTNLLNEQPAPTGGVGDMWLRVVADPVVRALTTPNVRADILRRRAVGIARYGVLLGMGNSRDTTSDAYQEALDLVVYAHRGAVLATAWRARWRWLAVQYTAVILARIIRGAP